MTNPVAWAEKDLGAQQVWDESQRVIEDLKREMGVRDAFASEIRVHEFKLDEQKAIVTERAAAAVAEKMGAKTTQAAIDRAVKEELANDDACRTYRQLIVEARINLDAADSRVEGLKIQARAITARMDLVAQQLAFFAACKNAETVARNQLLGSPGSKWPF